LKKLEKTPVLKNDKLREKLTSTISDIQDTLQQRFFYETRKQFDQGKNVPLVDLKNLKKSKQIYKTFVAMRKGHIEYFDKFPKFIKQKIKEHLKASVTTLEFDANKLQSKLKNLQTMTSNRATFIATDQLGKHLSAINQAQNRYIGAKSYIWRTVKDGRVRDEHALRDGKVIDYDKPPPDGHAGFPPRCRCYQEAIIE
jgi:SPP1 gp7 family putative phage head morphogenesis protein